MDFSTLLLARNARYLPDAPAVGEGDRIFTFAELEERTARLAGALAGLGLEPGDRFAVYALTELEYFEFWLAAARSGTVVVPLSFRLTVPELKFQIEDSEAKAIIVSPEFMEVGEQLREQVTGVTHWISLRAPRDGWLDYDALVGEARPIHQADRAADQPVCHVYTSGTTGTPKAAVLTNAIQYARLLSFALEVPIEPGDSWLQPAPMFHMGAVIPMAWLLRGCPAYVLRLFNTDQLMSTTESKSVTHIALAPTMTVMLLNDEGFDSKRLSSLKRVLYAGPIARPLMERALKAIPCEWMQFYGQTETSLATVLPPEEHQPKGEGLDRLKSAGRASLLTDVRVVTDEGRDVKPGEMGEIIVRGPANMVGYWNRPEENAQVLDHGWVHTGDIATMDDEGYVTIVDRKKDMIRTGAENVSAQEVDEALCAHPMVKEAAVIGVPDDTWGERVFAYVVPTTPDSLSVEEVLEHARTRLAGFKVPREVRFVTELPYTATGKVAKSELRKEHWAGLDRAVH